MGRETAATSESSKAVESSNQCMVVGIGASAGALEAFTQLLKALPREPGMAFVLIPHLDPNHRSVMTELLARVTSMKVLQAVEGLSVKENTVYVIPPNRIMTISGGILRLGEREPRPALSMPIDTFFRSLANDCGHNAIGVILSGTASDGTLGIAAIKHEGGITFAQDRSAKYDSMPNSAISSGFVDFVLPPEEIANELVRVSRHPYVAAMNGDSGKEIDATPSGDMGQVLHMLKQYRRVDFSDYKPATIRRRILRRMALARVESLGEYVRLLTRNAPELESLHNDILINVTSFFRDPEAFQALTEVVYPAVLRGRMQSDTIRIWVPGCSTGEEAYSHAISLVEHLSKERADVAIQIFGTDLSESAIRSARSGIYKESVAADVSPARLLRFFRKVEGGYQISKSIRDMCVFATQDVFNDPPFSRMDLVSCRNVLIYVGPALQKRVIPIFHYALKPNGFLMVGNTEGIVGAGADLFEPADKRHRIYKKKLAVSPVAFGIPPEHYDPRQQNAPGPTPMVMRETESARTPIELQREADRLLLTRFVPAAVVINEHFDILQTRGKASRYLELPSGKASLNLLKMAKPGLLFHLQKTLDEAHKAGVTVRKDSVRLEIDGEVANVHLEVIPFQAPLQQSQSFVIVFEERDGEQPAKAVVQRLPESEDAKEKQIGQLKQELEATKDYLQSIIEALEASNEELQSANEEIQSGNEELQSTNEELQTSKEELESANEELNTVNEEMQHRNLQLTQVNNDLQNLLASVNIPILMLDADLSIRRMTPQAEDVMGVTAADLGRPIRRLRLKLNIPNLEATMLDVIEQLRPRELNLNDGPNRKYRLRITPYRTMDNRIEGVVLACIDMASLTRDGNESAAPQAKKAHSRDKGK